MDFRQIRTTVIQAIFSDEKLTELLVLKGGNALEIGLNLVSRGSLDVDLSTPAAFEDVADIRDRIFAALRDRFDAHGIVVFDERFEEIPPEDTDDNMPWWGGYCVTFKLLQRSRMDKLASLPDKARIAAMTIGGGQERVFKIDISKCEFCGTKDARDLGGFTIWIYTPAMLVIEKLRAICQQMPEYETLRHKRARARDFFDIHTIVSRLSVDLAEEQCQHLCRSIFAAKHVPLRLLARIGDTSVREFHRPDWGGVVASVIETPPAEFDFYFNFTARETAKLKPLWEI